jgi:hypothetical protein
MKVKELVELLQQHDPELEVTVDIGFRLAPVTAAPVWLGHTKVVALEYH